MSLEDKVAALTDAVTANTDALQHLAAAIRGASGVGVPKLTAVVTPKAETPAAAAAAAQEGPADAADPPKRGPGRPPKSPATQAAAKGATTSSTQASAQGAANGSAVEEPELTYADLSEVVPKVAEKFGRSKALALFAELGVTSGKELQDKGPEVIGKAVRLFRGALK